MVISSHTDVASIRVGGKHDERFPVVTLNLAQVARLLGVSYGTCWDEVGRTGEIAGVKAIRVGRRYTFPAAKIAEALGIEVHDLISALSQGDPTPRVIGPAF